VDLKKVNARTVLLCAVESTYVVYKKNYLLTCWNQNFGLWPFLQCAPSFTAHITHLFPKFLNSVLFSIIFLLDYRESTSQPEVDYSMTTNPMMIMSLIHYILFLSVFPLCGPSLLVSKCSSVHNKLKRLSL